MKLKKSLRINGKLIPSGTTLTFGTEGYATIKGVLVHKSQIPEAAIEQKGSVLAKSIRFGTKTVTAGTELFFDANGIASVDGQDISIYQIPSKAFTGAIEQKGSVLAKSIRFGTKTITAGTELFFDANGVASVDGQDISIYQIPSKAFKGAIEAEAAMINNEVDTNEEFKSFDDVEPGDIGIGQDGQPIRFLGKAVGKAGYDSLVGQFGDASGKDFEELTVGIDDEDINETQFVAYTIADGTVCIGIYGADYVIATSANEADGDFIDASEVVSGDDAVDSEGKPCTIVAKGEGTVWFTKMINALQLDCKLSDIANRLDIDEDDAALKSGTFVVIVNDSNVKCIDIYGQNGVKVFTND